MPQSTLIYSNIPSAILSDGVVTIPIWSVSTISLSETYHLPPVGPAGSRAIVATHDDTVTLSGVLVGPERHAWKLGLENLADSSKRGSALAAMTGGRVGGLILITSMTIRTDMQVQTLTFTASSAKRDTLDVSMTLVHMPLPGALGKLLDLASLGVAALADWKGS
jgi:phage protein U